MQMDTWSTSLVCGEGGAVPRGVFDGSKIIVSRTPAVPKNARICNSEYEGYPPRRRHGPRARELSLGRPDHRELLSGFIKRTRAGSKSRPSSCEA